MSTFSFPRNVPASLTISHFRSSIGQKHSTLSHLRAGQWFARGSVSVNDEIVARVDEHCGENEALSLEKAVLLRGIVAQIPVKDLSRNLRKRKGKVRSSVLLMRLWTRDTIIDSWMWLNQWRVKCHRALLLSSSYLILIILLYYYNWTLTKKTVTRDKTFVRPVLARIFSSKGARHNVAVM